MKSVVKVGGDTDPPTMLGVGRLARGGGLGFVVAARGRKSVRAFANDGKLLWSRTLAATASPRTVRAVDVDGDGVDEVILGTGGDGVFALDATGQQRWHSLVDSFVFDIAVVPGGSKERPLIAVGGTGSFLRLLDATGEVVRKIHAEMAFYRVASRIAPPDKYEIIGGAAHPVQLQSVTIEGASRWYVRDDDALFRRTRMSTIAVSPDGRWVAVTMKDSRILVYDAADGRRVSMRFTGGSTYPALVWTFDADGSTPLLIQAASYGMAAFRLSAPAR